MSPVDVRLLFANGTTKTISVDHGATGIQYRDGDGFRAFRETGESDDEGRDTYAEEGCSWTRVHANGMVANVIATPLGNFAAWATPREPKAAGTYSTLSAAKAVADEEAACDPCRCAGWRWEGVAGD
jgi:hypothetical protein